MPFRRRVGGYRPECWRRDGEIWSRDLVSCFDELLIVGDLGV